MDAAESASGAAAGPAPDIVKIRNMRAWSLIGVHPHERLAPQEIRIDVWLETEELAAIALDQFDARAVRLSVEKPGAVPGTDAVGIEIERRRTSGPSGRAR